MAVAEDMHCLPLAPDSRDKQHPSHLLEKPGRACVLGCLRDILQHDAISCDFRKLIRQDS